MRVRGNPMIIDSFLYFNELELLEIRLEELKDVVDLFVLAEGCQTTSGKKKPLFFEEVAERFKEYNIEHIVIREDLSYLSSAWDRETYFRNAISEHLRQMEIDGSTLVMLSDVDEIPPATAVQFAAASLPNEPPGTIYVFEQLISYYYVNCRSAEVWKGSRMARWADIGNMQDLRGRNGVVILNGGWHFSFLGGADRIRYKIQSYSHTELDRPCFTDLEAINARIASGDDLFDRDARYTCIPLDESFPAYLLKNRERFKDLISPNENPGRSCYTDQTLNSTENGSPAGLLERGVETPFTLLAHIGNLGDVRTNLGQIQRMHGNQNIEGFAIYPNEQLCGEISYKARLFDGKWTDWANAGEYVGTRSQSRSLTGLSVRIRQTSSEDIFWNSFAGDSVLHLSHITVLKAVEVCFYLIRLQQDFAGFDAVLCADNSLGFHCLNHARGTCVANLEFSL